MKRVENDQHEDDDQDIRQALVRSHEIAQIHDRPDDGQILHNKEANRRHLKAIFLTIAARAQIQIDQSQAEKIAPMSSVVRCRPS